MSKKPSGEKKPMPQRVYEAYQQGRVDALKTIDKYKTLTKSDKVFIVNDEWAKSIKEQIRSEAITDFANRLMNNEVIDKSVIRRVAEQMMREAEQ